jgi:hypothetical protein
MMTDLERIQDYIDNRTGDEPESADLLSAEEFGDEKCTQCWGHGSVTENDGDGYREWVSVNICDCVYVRVEVE